MAWLLGTYICVALSINLVRFKSIHHNDREILSHVFDGSAFAGSVLVFMGVLDPAILKLIGGAKPMLITASMGGMVWSIGVLWPRNNSIT